MTVRCRNRNHVGQRIVAGVVRADIVVVTNLAGSTIAGSCHKHLSGLPGLEDRVLQSPVKAATAPAVIGDIRSH